MKINGVDVITAISNQEILRIVGDTIYLGGQHMVVPNNRRPILGTMSVAETITLGGMLDRLESLEEAIRVRPNARAIAAFRESIVIETAMAEDGDQAERLSAQCGAILLDMLDKIMAVKP